jgi:hypothetical protein
MAGGAGAWHLQKAGYKKMSLGLIKAAARLARYTVRYTWAQPEKIDFFSLLILEIIACPAAFTGLSMTEALRRFEIPADIDNIFEEQTAYLKSLSPPMIVTTDAINAPLLLTPVSSWTITEQGKTALSTKELPQEPQTETALLAYDAKAKTLVVAEKITQQEDPKSIVVDMTLKDGDGRADELFPPIIAANKSRFGLPEKARILQLQCLPAGEILRRETIEINLSEDGNKLNFACKTPAVLAVFNAMPQHDREMEMKKIFEFLHIACNSFPLETAKIAVTRSSPLRLSVVFGESAAIKHKTEAELVISDISSTLSIPANLLKGFNWAGVLTDGRTVVYRYNEADVGGVKLPLESFSYKDKDYLAIFQTIKPYYIEILKQAKTIEMCIPFLFRSCPVTERSSLAREILSIDFADTGAGLLAIETLAKEAGNRSDIQNLKNGKLISVIHNALDSGKIDAKNAVKIALRNNLSIEKIFYEFASMFEMNDSLVNYCLGVDEQAAIKAFNLVAYYNELLRNEELTTISHNNNIYAAFAKYERQLIKLHSLGFKDYYTFMTPAGAGEWDALVQEVYLLQALFNRLRKWADEYLIKQADDFFTEITDEYDDIAPAMKGMNQLIDKEDWEEQVRNGIKQNEPDYQMLGFAIRAKYADYLRTEERKKDIKMGTIIPYERKGRTLIQYVCKNAQIKDCYRNWKNLNILVHKEQSEKIETLWTGPDEYRKKALSDALNFYDKYFRQKKEAKK